MLDNGLKINNDETQLTDEEAFAEVEGIAEGQVTARHLLTFAKLILFVVALMYSLAAISELLVPHNSVFEASKVTLPSIATLVIGYYFGSSK